MRDELGASQDDVAYAADVNRSYLASLEAGQRNPSLDIIARLAIALKCDMGELVNGLQRKKGHPSEAQPVRIRHRHKL